MTSVLDLLSFSSRPKMNLILQTEVAECGIASLAMVMNYHGHKTDLNTLRRNHPISLKGTTLETLIHLAASVHFSSRPLRLELKELGRLRVPCILHWDMNHFVVLSGVKKGIATIYDPAKGRYSMSLQEVSKHFTGVALELMPTKQFEKKDDVKKVHFSHFWKQITGLKRVLLQLFSLSFVLQVLALINPIFMQLVVDEVIVSRDYDLLIILALGFLMLMLIEAGVNAFRSFIVMHMSTQLNIQMANNLLSHLLHLPLSFFEKRHIGDILSRFASLDAVKKLLTTGLVETFIDGIMLVGTLIMMFIYGPVLSFVVLAAVCLYAALRWMLYMPMKRLTEENVVASAKEDSNFMETIRAIQGVKLFGHEAQRQTLWQNRYAEVMNTGIRLNKLDIGYNAIKALLFGIENILVIYLAAQLVIGNEMSIGMLFAFMAYKLQFTARGDALIEKFIQFKMLDLHLTRLGDIALTEREKDLEVSVPSGTLSGKLRLDNLAFRYSEGEPYLFQDLSVDINAGESLAITGPSGSGKTTLMKIMLGLFEADKGCVLADDVDIRKLGLRNYRNQIAAVMQDDQLLSGTIGDNICFFEPNFNQAKIEHCAQLAAIHDDIVAMPMGYNSLIGDMGTTLSGGQKQRVLLARALYAEPRILFLDEATSHLDIRHESLINEAVKQLQITRVIIAHRTQTIQSADRIFALDGGVFKAERAELDNNN